MLTAVIIGSSILHSFWTWTSQEIAHLLPWLWSNRRTYKGKRDSLGLLQCSADLLIQDQSLDRTHGRNMWKSASGVVQSQTFDLGMYIAAMTQPTPSFLLIQHVPIPSFLLIQHVPIVLHTTCGSLFASVREPECGFPVTCITESI